MHNQFCREPDAGKPHVRIYAGVRPVRGVSTHQVQHTFSVWEVLVYNSDYKEVNYKTVMGNNSELTIPVNDGSLYYIVVEQSWNYGSYKLNLQ